MSRSNRRKYLVGALIRIQKHMPDVCHIVAPSGCRFGPKAVDANVHVVATLLFTLEPEAHTFRTRQLDRYDALCDTPGPDALDQQRDPVFRREPGAQKIHRDGVIE